MQIDRKDLVDGDMDYGDTCDRPRENPYARLLTFLYGVLIGGGVTLLILLWSYPGHAAEPLTPTDVKRVSLSCYDQATYLDHLRDGYGERLAQLGTTTHRNTALFFFNADTRTWTMAFMKEDGSICPLLYGTDWESPLGREKGGM